MQNHRNIESESYCLTLIFRDFWSEETAVKDKAARSPTHRKPRAAPSFTTEEETSQSTTVTLICAMRASTLLLLLFLLGVCDVLGASAFRICAFNLHSFGESKSQKTKVMHTLTRIISRCDVSLLQEVRDAGGNAVPLLLKRLNSYDSEHQYKSVSSERLGRSNYQEQYVFVYRADTVSVTGQYQYPDVRPGDVDAFSREPFIVRFKAPRTDIKEFVLIPQHTTPANTTRELDALYDVLQDVRRMWKTENVMLLGDFNADCGYLAKKNRKHVRLLTDKTLYWLIPEKTDTTVRSSTSCTYDRIVVHGERFARAVVPSSAGPFNFQTAFRLTEEEALDVSDHYPVEVLLKDAANRLSVQLLLFILGFFVFQMLT